MPIPPKKVINADTGTSDIVGGNDWDDAVDHWANIAQEPYTYYIYKDGSTYKAKNGATGIVTYSNTDFKTVIQAIIDTIPTRDATVVTKIKIGSGVYNVNSVITILDKYNLHIEGSGEQITEIRAGSTLGATAHMIDIFGSVSGVGKNLTANGVQRAFTVTVSTTDAGTFAVGDWVLLRSTKNFGNAGTGKQGEIKQIVSRDTGTGIITFSVPLFDGYLTANTANIIKLNLSQNITLSNLSVNKDTGYTGTGKWVNLKFVNDFRVNNLTLMDPLGSFDCCLVINSCINGRINACHFIMNMAIPYTNQYGVAIQNCSQNITIANSTSRGNWRHPFEAANNKNGTDDDGPCRAITFDGCTGSDCTQAVFDTHGMGEGITFTNCSVLGKRSAYGIQIRTGRSIVSNCYVQSTENDGISIDNLDAESFECEISDCVVVDSGQSGIAIESGMIKTRISGCLLKNSTNHGIVLEGTNDFTMINNNMILDNDQDGINVLNSDNCMISNNIIKDNGDYGIEFSSGDCIGNMISNNNFSGNTTGIINNGDQTGNMEVNNLGYTNGFSLRKRPEWVSDMLDSTGIAPFIATAIGAGTLSATAATTVDAEHCGIVRIQSAAAADTGYRIRSSSSAILLGGGEVFETIVNFVGFTNNTIRIGLNDTATVADSVDGVYFEIVGSSTITGKTANNSTRSSTGTTYTASTGTWYRLRIIVTSSSRVDFYIYNDSGTQLWTNNLTANIPTGAGRYTGVQIIATNSTSSATDIMDVDYMAFFAGGRVALTR